MDNTVYQRSLLKLTFVCIFYGFMFIPHVETASHVCTKRVSYLHNYSTRCNGVFRCRRNRIKYRSTRICCTGYRTAPNRPALECDRAICGGKIDPGACNVYYSNSWIKYNNGFVEKNSGGTCVSPDRCRCDKPGFYSNTNRCRICSRITNCQFPICTTASDHTCARCNYYYGPGAGEQGYVLSNNRKSCIKACSWRSDSTRCYPGTCQNQHASACRCTSGFEGTHCQRITAKPTINEASVRVTAENGDYVDLDLDNKDGFTNIIDPKSISLKLTSDFQKTVPARHSYITDYKVGIIGGSVGIEKESCEDINGMSDPLIVPNDHIDGLTPDQIDGLRSTTTPIRISPDNGAVTITLSSSDIGLGSLQFINTENLGSIELTLIAADGKETVANKIAFGLTDDRNTTFADEGNTTFTDNENITFTDDGTVSFNSEETASKIRFSFNPVNASNDILLSIILKACFVKTNVPATTVASTNKVITISCPSDANRDRPNTAIFPCQRNVDLSSITPPFKHREKFVFMFETFNGGYVKVKNLETNIIETKYYTGTSELLPFTLGIDTIEPYHCRPSCNSVMLTDLDHVTETTVLLEWDGWKDDYSDIKNYDLEITKLHRVGEKLDVKEQVFVNTTSDNQMQVSFSSTGVFSIILTANDYARNYKKARRIVIYDPNPQVTTTSNSSLKITTANPTGPWQTQLQSVTVDWNNYFINLVHHNGRFLAEVESVTGVESSYDDNEGKRRTAAISNVQGIVKYSVVYKIDHKGGNSITEPTDEEYQDTRSLDQQVTIKPDLNDGDTLKYFIRAYDILDSYKQESVSVQFDSSPPEIKHLWLTKGNITDIVVHGYKELDKMVIEWEAYDIHSGVNLVKWRIYDNNSDVEHGSDHISIQGDTTSLEECQSKYSNSSRGHNCYCTPDSRCFHRHFQIKPKLTTVPGEGIQNHLNQGSHDHDYSIEITVTNVAGLTTVRRRQITIDTSPPHVGHVHDGLYGEAEVDYQKDYTLKAHWEGFFDKESGVKFFQYAFGKSCTDARIFGIGSEDVSQTTITNAEWRAKSSGKYYITVVAYNRAMELSKPVCSDGVTIDPSAPIISEVYLEGSKVKGGLVRFEEGDEVWYITDFRKKILLENSDDTCRDKATKAGYLSLSQIPTDIYPIITLSARQWCHKDPIDFEFTNKVYLSKHSHLFVNWTGTDKESGIYDYEFGLATSKDSASAPDIFAYVSTNHHAWYNGHHPDLSDGTEFFICIKAINKAGTERIQTVGPVYVHNKPPTYTDGTVDISFTDNKISVDWSSGKFLDPETKYIDVSVAMGSQPGEQDILPYTFQSEVGTSCPSSSQCVIFTQSDLHWDLHHNFTYYASLRVKNIVDLYNVYTSSAYVHNTRKPNNGIVYEVVKSDEEQDFKTTELEDSDFQLSTTSLKVRWFGFESEDLAQHINYKVGLGSQKGLVDIAEVSKGTATFHTFQGLNLQLHKTYYVTVTASSDAGMVQSTSNGVTIVKKNSDLSGMIKVKDGPICDALVKQPAWKPNNYHESENKRCKDDIEYQISTSIYNAHWTVNDNIKHMYPEIKWSLQVKQDNTDDIWNTVDQQDFLLDSGHLSQPVVLDYCKTYRSSIRFCSRDVCSQPVVSNGVSILSQPAQPLVTVTHNTRQTSQLEVILDYAEDSQNSLCSPDSSVDKYEWSITDNKHNSHLFTKWMKVNQVQKLDANKFQFKISLEGELDFSECIRVAIRIYNKAGLTTVVSADVKDCSDPELVKPSIVIDAVGQPVQSDPNTNQQGLDIVLEQNAIWPKQDVDYTPYSNLISAVWPSLRHQSYEWGIIEDNTFNANTHFVHQQQIIKDLCSHPKVFMCGKTEKEYVNIHPLQLLKHGHRYHVCIHAENITVVHEIWTEHLPEINECSDGITVDLTQPSEGQIWVGNLPDSKYQSSSSDVSVYWDSFVDVEENGGKVVHSSGISQYSIAIGSVKGGEDILAKQNVGLVNHKIVHGLLLQNGHSYYVTLQAYDFVNRYKTVYSEPLIVDGSRPKLTSKPIQFSGSYLTSKTTFSVCWTGSFKDSESGLSGYRWAIGSRPGYQDVEQFIQTPNDCGESILNPGLQDGLTYYVTVEATNGAGLTTALTSRPIIADSTKPVGGHVLDVTTDNIDSDDIDYITNSAKLVVRWLGFHDPHSSIKHYKIKLGTYTGSDNIIEEFEAGIATHFAFHLSNLIPGRRYITTVTGCNMVELCTSVSSDGVIFDKTPPVPGKVFDGTKSYDIDFQAVRNYIGAKWYGFEDSESGILRYEWRVGTSKGGDEIYKTEILPVVELAYKSNIPDNKLLPVGTRVYITVKAVNKAGLSSEATSNGFVIDTSKPIIEKPQLSTKFSTIITSSSISQSSLSINWKSTDPESYIERQYISLSPHVQGEFDPTLTEIPSILSEYTLSLLDLHDGSKYNIKVIACNMAGLCQSAVTDGILVDSSPPLPGTFAIGSNHSAEVNRGNVESIYWKTDGIDMAWIGFFDLHSGISHYLITVGSKPFSKDLNQNDQEARFDHNGNGEDYKHEGKRQMFAIPTKKLTSGSSVFLAIWAVNGVGLKSQPLHVEMTIRDFGFIEMVRRCDSYSCEGHCVCAPENKKCSSSNNCNDLTKANPNNLLEVHDVVNLQSFDVEASYTSSDNYLAAGWKVANQQGLVPIRYEMSVGDRNNDEPTGIFNTATERVWYDMGLNTQGIISLPKGKALLDSVSYSAFIKVWYSNDRFAVFKSPGITVILHPPTVSHIASASIKELESKSSTKDIDYQTSTTEINIGWTNKFRGGPNGLRDFIPYISTHPQGHNVLKTDIRRTGTDTTFTATGLTLQEDHEYYSSIVAYNKAGLSSWATSDGVTIDNTSPLSGPVHDGNDVEDSDYQSSVNTLAASWYGFTDSDSGLVRYYWCVSTVNDDKDCNIQQWTNVGLKTKVYINTTTPLIQGTKLYHKVYVEDGSKLKSLVSISNGIIVDSTPPYPVDIEYLSTDILLNPSFEQVTLTDKTCDDQVPNSWKSDSTSCVKSVQSHPTVPKDGATYIKVTGRIQQTVSVEVGKVYLVSIHVGYPHDVSSQHHAVEGFVQLGKEINTFKLNPDPCQTLCNSAEQPVILWYKYSYVYHPAKTSEDIIIGTTKANMILAIDHVQLQEIKYIIKGDDSNHLHHHTVFRPFWSSVHLSWHFTDTESHITDNKYALGTVKGGTQIREFTSVGGRQHVTLTGLQLAHNTLLYLTVLATNKAGLMTVSRSDSIIVDMTAPTVDFINDGIGSDVKYQLGKLVSVNWKIEDKESGIDYCECAIGTTKGGIDVKPFSRVTDGQNSVQFEMAEVTKSTQIYSVVRCYNKAGLPITAITDGVLIVPNTPQLTNGQFVLFKDSITPYSVSDSCHAQLESLRFEWSLQHGGIETRAIQVKLNGEGIDLNKEIRVEDINYDQSKISNIKLRSNTNYSISVSSINTLGRQDNTVLYQFTSLSQPPIVTDVSKIKTAKSLDGKMVEISWRDLFTSIWTDLFYEVSLTTTKGGADILQWQETKKPTLSVHVPDTSKVMVLYLTLTAVDPCGLFTHYNHTLTI